jgi:hypothetical protein
MQQYRDAKAIRTYRMLTELRLSDLLKKAHSMATLDDIQRLIFDESDLMPPSYYFRQIIALFDTTSKKIDENALLRVVQDAWNYFPHLSLSGYCPVEVLRRLSAVDVTISHLSEMGDIEFDDDKIDDAALALLLLGFHAKARVWKRHDWNVLDRLFQKGYITDPTRKAKSVMLTDRGLAEAKRLFKKLFARSRPAVRPLPN